MSIRRYRLGAMKALFEIGVLGGAFTLACLIRFEGSLTAPFIDGFPFTLPLVVLVQFACLALCGVRRSSWRHIDFNDARRILASLALAALLLATWRWTSIPLGERFPLLRPEILPLGAVLFNLPLSYLGILGLRVARRWWSERREHGHPSAEAPSKVPTLLIGAGQAGALVAREIARRSNMPFLPVGFLDDDPTLQGLAVNGIGVLGPIAGLPEIARKHGARQAIITIARGPGAAIRRITQLCAECGIPAKIIPPLHEMLDGRINLSAIRDVAIEDILRRKPVQLDGKGIAGLVGAETILITGAGGSIGLELCREVCRFAPNRLVLVEQAENSLFHCHRQLAHEFPHLEIVPCIADICDRPRMEEVLSFHSPAVIFHAAAHKHVPMMERNPGEAVKNNVLGTVGLAQLADTHGVHRFVMISTDKAVNPSSVMGASKRVAELFIQALSRQSETCFSAVRFGNVLGSNGSVIPIFKEQIARGGPVTVTHPEMKRYFMTIPEACQLVLQAASMGKGGEIFILDMGEPVKIVDLARDLIRLSGLRPGKDVEIRFTGLRPGEKLFEELFLGDEQAAKTYHPRIFIGRLKALPWEEINRQVRELGDLARHGDARKIYAKFKEIVPEYHYVRHDAAADPLFKPMHAARLLQGPGVVGIILANDPV